MTESLAWTCPKCSAWCWNHHANCAACGQQKPAPPPAETPSDETRPEPPWRMEDQYERMLRDARAEIERQQLAADVRRAFPMGWR